MWLPELFFQEKYFRKIGNLLLKCCSRVDILQSEQRKATGKTGTKNRREDELMLLCGICAACLVGIMVVYVTVL